MSSSASRGYCNRAFSICHVRVACALRPISQRELDLAKFLAKSGLKSKTLVLARFRT